MKKITELVISNRKLKVRIVAQLKTEIHKRETTLCTYADKIIIFSAANKIDPFDFQTMTLTEIENMTKLFITSHLDDIAPKSLNVYYCAIKSWTFALGKINSRKAFKEIIFDKATRQMDAIMEQPLEPKTMQMIFEIADANEKALIGVYGLNGMRPALIPQMKISWIFPAHYKIENNKFRFTVKNPFFYIPKNLTGNKASGITFFSILHSKIATAIEQSINMLNEVGTITRDTPLIGRYTTKGNLSAKIKTLFAVCGFSGRPYLLRSFADYVYDSAGLKRANGMPDNDFKEQLMLHKGLISAIYQGHGLPESVIAEYTQMYQAVENWINEHVFGMVSGQQLDTAKQLGLFARGLGVNESQITIMLEALNNGRTTYDKFSEQLKELTDKAFSNKMTVNMENVMMAFMEKRGLIAPTYPLCKQLCGADKPKAECNYAVCEQKQQARPEQKALTEVTQ